MIFKLTINTIMLFTLLILFQLSMNFIPPFGNSAFLAQTDHQKQIKNPSQVLGIDVSHFQGDVNWDEIKKAGIIFVYDKATEGETYVDPKYARNRLGAHEYDLLHGSYHFFESDDDPKKQAELFISVIEHKPGDMPPVLDLEEGGIKGEVSLNELSKNIMTFLKYVEEKLNVKPIIYTNHKFGNKYLTDPEFAKYELWIAEYDVPQPLIPDIWKNQGWLIWQRTERGKIEGSIGDVDHDLLNPSKKIPVYN